jgi:hypothetical protein
MKVPYKVQFTIPWRHRVEKIHFNEALLERGENPGTPELKLDVALPSAVQRYCQGVSIEEFIPSNFGDISRDILREIYELVKDLPEDASFLSLIDDATLAFFIFSLCDLFQEDLPLYYLTPVSRVLYCFTPAHQDGFRRFLHEQPLMSFLKQYISMDPSSGKLASQAPCGQLQEL